jgi:hypothetical protein
MGDYEEREYDFPTMIKGDNFYWSMQIKDDANNIMTGLTGATISCIAKSFPGGPTLKDFSANFTLTVATATLVFDLSAAETAALTWSDAVYKLKVTLLSGAVKTYLYGTMKVDLG